MNYNDAIQLGGVLIMLLIFGLSAWQNHLYRRDDRHRETDAERARKISDQIQLQDTVKGLCDDVSNGIKEMKDYMRYEVGRLDDRVDGCHHRSEILEERFNKHANGGHK
jgi:hypothetical protein